MTCQEDVVPVYIVVMIYVLFFLMYNAFRGFTINEQFHKNRLKKGLPWNTSVSEYAADLEKIKNRYGKVVYYICYKYVILTIELFDRPYRALIVTSVFFWLF